MKWLALVVFAFAFFPQPSMAYPEEWAQLTGPVRASCTKSYPCYAKDKKTGALIKVTFVTIPDGDLFVVDKIEINGDKPEKSTAYELDEMDGTSAGQEDQLYAADINGDGSTDLALYATITTKGPLYYYFLQDPKTGKFSLDGEPRPEPESKLTDLGPAKAHDKKL